MCWGFNYQAALGDGTRVDRIQPVDAAGLTSGVRAIAAARAHTCALTTGGGVKCWGYGRFGQLGDGTGKHRKTPVDVVGLTSGVKAIAVGSYFSCALLTGGSVRCWGQNYYDQLGNPDAGKISTSPVGVEGLPPVTAISAGDSHVCALTTEGGVMCWGGNYRGELGNVETGYASTPVPRDVDGLTSGVAAISAGGLHTCALLVTGKVMCWGDDRFGQLGDGRFQEYRTEPAEVIKLRGEATAISAGALHTCALVARGRLMCWGHNDYSQVGPGLNGDAYYPQATPVFVLGFGGIRASGSIGDLSYPSKVRPGTTVRVRGPLRSPVLDCRGARRVALISKGRVISRATTRPDGGFSFPVKVMRTITVRVQAVTTTHCRAPRSQPVTIEATG